mmetsp:Transcript_13265/g.35539  ORF Transcript_13265/g.35539 Transcript_13265/m.35539 type:complete len:241 (+) Transcript_13265:1141-1863(+)
MRSERWLRKVFARSTKMIRSCRFWSALWRPRASAALNSEAKACRDVLPPFCGDASSSALSHVPPSTSRKILQSALLPQPCKPDMITQTHRASPVFGLDKAPLRLRFAGLVRAAPVAPWPELPSAASPASGAPRLLPAVAAIPASSAAPTPSSSKPLTMPTSVCNASFSLPEEAKSTAFTTSGLASSHESTAASSASKPLPVATMARTARAAPSRRDGTTTTRNTRVQRARTSACGHTKKP